MMKKLLLDDYEKELQELEKKDLLDSRPLPASENEKYIQLARDHNRKTERITIRLTAHDLMQLKLNASCKGIPYQTLATSIIHQYNTGDLKSDISA